MEENQGWHKIPRSLYDSDLWNALSVAGRLVMIRMLERANYKQTQVKLYNEVRTIEVGQILISRKTLTEKTGATNQQIRTAVGTMQLFNFLTKETTKGNQSIYTINKGFFADCKNKQPRKQPTNNQPSTNEQPDQRKKEGKEKELQVIEDLFLHWNSRENLVKHRELSNRIISAINPKLDNYTPDEIKKAFDNYDFVIGSTDHYWTCKWPLVIFMQREHGFLSFVDDADPRVNFLKEMQISKSDALRIKNEAARQQFLEMGKNHERV